MEGHYQLKRSMTQQELIHQPIQEIINGKRVVYQLVQKENLSGLMYNERLMMLNGDQFGYGNLLGEMKVPFRTQNNVPHLKTVLKRQQIVQITRDNGHLIIIPQNKSYQPWKIRISNEKSLIFWMKITSTFFKNKNLQAEDFSSRQKNTERLKIRQLFNNHTTQDYANLRKELEEQRELRKYFERKYLQEQSRNKIS